MQICLTSKIYTWLYVDFQFAHFVDESND